MGFTSGIQSSTITTLLQFVSVVFVKEKLDITAVLIFRTTALMLA